MTRGFAVSGAGSSTRIASNGEGASTDQSEAELQLAPERTFPAASGIKVAQHWAGLIDVTPDAVPVISSVDSQPALVVATGFSSTVSASPRPPAGLPPISGPARARSSIPPRSDSPALAMARRSSLT
jgi:hypothetical protein